MKMNLALIALLVLSSIQVGFSADYYVYIKGYDGNTGGASNAWRTLKHALSQVPANQGHTIHISAGTFVESGTLVVPSGVNIIGAGSGETIIKVNRFFYMGDNANPHVNTYPEEFVMQVEGSNQTIKGFSLNGQDKQCHGGIFSQNSTNINYTDLDIQDFRYCGLWVVEAFDVIIQDCYLRNNTFGNTASSSQGGGDSGSLQYHRGKNLTIRDCEIIEPGCNGPGKGGYCMKGQNRTYGGTSTPLENLKIYNCTLIAPSLGAWQNYNSPGFCMEFLTVKLKNMEIYNNYMNRVISMPSSEIDWAGRIHHNTWEIGVGSYGYAMEMHIDNIEVDHNYISGGLYPLAMWGSTAYNHIVHHNTFVDIAAGDFSGRELIRYSGKATKFKFYNNTIIDNQNIGHLFKFNGGGVDVDIRNNIFYNTKSSSKDNWGNSDISGTISKNSFYKISPKGSNYITSNPNLGPSPEFKLQSGSPCINAGDVISGITDGYKGSAPDIGADEYQGSTSDQINAGDVIWLKAKVNNKFVCADLNINSSAPLFANRTAVGGWEKFEVTNAGSGWYRLIAQSNGKYVSARQDEGDILQASSTIAGSWEKVKFEYTSDGFVALKFEINGKYVAAENAGEDQLVANRNAINNWEKFSWGKVSANARKAASPLEIIEEQSINNFKLYPNPNTNGFFVEWAGEEKAEIRIFNTVGKLIHLGNYQPGDKISFEAPAGLYLLRTKIESEIIERKLILK